ncbi:MAG TPA: holo-ACP synthase [Burkholderiaceae bacterium]|nr:holo-ACP synthase [Burkholderiaceae bacterium]
MIFGIGTDIVEIGRIRGAVARFGDRFPQRVLGARELERYRDRRSRSEQRGLKFLATRFAAKEAVSKALGLGMRWPMTWRAVEILNDPSGRPVAFVSSAELRRFTERKRLRLHVSITDERELAMAYAVAEVQGA